MEPHDEPVGRSLGARPCDFHVLAQDELEPAAQASLDGGNVDLALPLRTVAIADREQRTRGVDRHIERGAGAHILIVDVTGVDSGRTAADPPQGRRGSNPHRSEERRR